MLRLIFVLCYSKSLTMFNLKGILIYLMIGWSIAPVLGFIDKYVFNDWEFIKFLLVICSVDTVLGFVKAAKLRVLSSRGFSMVFKKLIVYSCALIVTHVLVHFTVANKAYAVFAWFDYVIFSGIMVRETISIFENIAIIDPTAFPKQILKYLKDFDSITGHFKISNDLNNNKTENDEKDSSSK